MATRYASAKKALGVCDICGFTYKLRELKTVVVKNRDTNTQKHVLNAGTLTIRS